MSIKLDSQHPAGSLDGPHAISVAFLEWVGPSLGFLIGIASIDDAQGPAHHVVVALMGNGILCLPIPLPWVCCTLLSPIIIPPCAFVLSC